MSFKLQLGLNKCTNAEYHGDKSFLSSSSYKLLLENPAQFHREHILLEKRQEQKQDNLTAGSLTHTAILEPHLVDVEYTVYPGLRKAGAAFEQFVANNEGSGKTVISAAEHARAMAYKRAFDANPQAGQLLVGAEFEYTICGTFMGIPTKVRADAIQIGARILSDVKTTAFSVDEVAVKETVKKWSYDLSAALYSALAASHFGTGEFEFVWQFISKSDLECQVYRMSQATRDKGMRQLAKAAAIYHNCMKTGIWPETPPQKAAPTYGEIKEI